MTDDATKVADMARHLVDQKIDLGDERAVLRALTPRLGEASRFKHTSGDLMALYDKAIEAARILAAEQAVPQ